MQPRLVLAIALVATLLCAPTPAKISIEVAGSALNMSGDFAGLPDPGGGFTVGVVANLIPITASKCRAGLLSMGMSGARPDDSGAFTGSQRVMIKRKFAAFALLQSAKKSGTKVKIFLQPNPKYLFYKNGRLTSPYCSVTIDSVEALR